VLHLRIQAEVWERRPVWDRLVYPATVRVFRVVRAATGGGVTIRGADGFERRYANSVDVLPLSFAVGRAARLSATSRYYLRVVATIGTLAEREIEDVGDAAFGRASDANALGSLGRLIMSGALQISDYLQSVSAESTSGRVSGRDLLRR